MTDFSMDDRNFETSIAQLTKNSVKKCISILAKSLNSQILFSQLNPLNSAAKK